MKKLVLLGTSNGLIKGGISAAFSEFFDFTNLSVGASSSGLGIFFLHEYADVIRSADLVLVDYSINDNEHLTKGWIERDHLEKSLFSFFSGLVRLNHKVCCLIMPSLNYLDDVESNQGREVHLHAAKAFGFPVLDGYAFVAGLLQNFDMDSSSVFLDSAHLNASVAYSFGVSLVSIFEGLGANFKRQADLGILPEFDTKTISAKILEAQLGASRLLGTSAIKMEAVSLSMGLKVNCSVPGFSLSGVLLNANSKAKLKFTSHGCDDVVVKDVYSGSLPDEKVQIRFVPLCREVDAESLVMEIAQFHEKETELSPTGLKFFSTSDYGGLDVFGLVFIESNPRLVKAGGGLVAHDEGMADLIRSSSAVHSFSLNFDNYISQRLVRLANSEFELADIYREVALILIDRGDRQSAMKFVDLALGLRPDGEWLNALKISLAH